ncbi:MAG: hypothetical protein P1P88_26515, partial [Bacteroidales bacterium]|nr:hypothetical protein [Bacteroidales bacterium]
LNIKNKTIKTNVKLKSTPESAFRYIKMFLSRTKQLKLVIDFLKKENSYEETFCPFCGEKSDFNFIYKFSNEICILDIEHKTKFGKIDFYCYRGKLCSGGHLNPNSKEFISKSLKISNDEALKIIHNRNKSPFYRSNFSNDKEYKKAQQRDLNWYISKYGEIKGNQLF